MNNEFKHTHCTLVSILPHCLVATLALLNWTSTPAAEGPNEDVTGSLRYSDRISGLSYSPNNFDLADVPPEEDWMLPDARGSERLYGSWTVGNATKIKVVLDVMSEKELLMRFAFDENVDFRHKEDVPDDRTPVTFRIRYRDGQQETYSLRFNYSPLFSQEIHKKRLMYYRGSLRWGSLEIGGKGWMISLSDDNADGNYSDLANISGQIDLNGDGSLGRDERFVAQTPFHLDGTYYAVVRVSSSGDQITVRKAVLGRIEGVVVRGDGQAVPGATIELRGHNMRTTSDAEGKFNLEVPAGRFDFLTVLAPGCVPVHERLKDSVTAKRPLKVEVKMQPVSEKLSGELRLAMKMGYHVLAGTRQGLMGGDFYVNVSDNTVKFLSNNLFQRGLKDLGDIGDVDLDSLKISEQGTTRFGVEAIKGHTYVSLAKAGEEGSFVVFRVKDVTPGETVTIDFLYRQQEK